MELTPKSLPALLASGAGLDSTLVLWCDRDASSDMAETFRQQVSNNPHADLAFAWINRFIRSTTFRFFPTSQSLITLGMKYCWWVLNFGNFLQNRHFAKLKTSPKFPTIPSGHLYRHLPNLINCVTSLLFSHYISTVLIIHICCLTLFRVLLPSLSLLPSASKRYCIKN